MQDRLEWKKELGQLYGTRADNQIIKTTLYLHLSRYLRYTSTYLNHTLPTASPFYNNPSIRPIFKALLLIAGVLTGYQIYLLFQAIRESLHYSMVLSTLADYGYDRWYYDDCYRWVFASSLFITAIITLSIFFAGAYLTSNYLLGFAISIAITSMLPLWAGLGTPKLENTNDTDRRLTQIHHLHPRDITPSNRRLGQNATQDDRINAQIALNMCKEWLKLEKEDAFYQTIHRLHKWGRWVMMTASAAMMFMGIWFPILLPLSPLPWLLNMIMITVTTALGNKVHTAVPPTTEQPSTMSMEGTPLHHPLGGHREDIPEAAATLVNR